jgi:hypothetical protein
VKESMPCLKKKKTHQRNTLFENSESRVNYMVKGELELHCNEIKNKKGFKV